MLLYFLRGSLPWQGLTATDQTQKEELILEEKRRINTEDLCADLPQEFAVYFDYIGSLDFDEKPKYSNLRKIFRDLFVRERFDYDIQIANPGCKVAPYPAFNAQFPS